MAAPRLGNRVYINWGIWGKSMKQVIVWLLALVMVCPVGASDLPDWVEKLKFKGDFRLRGEFRDNDNDLQKDRNRARFRLRLAMSTELSESLKLDFRIASGTGSPTSTNVTLDNSFSGKDFRIDRIFITYRKRDWTIAGGKVANPFHTTDMVWDSDVNQEGFYQKYESDSFFVTLAQMFVEENSSSEDSNLLVAQFGAKFGGPVKAKVSSAYYHYEDFLGLSSFEFFDVLADFKLKFGSLPGSLKLHYAQNTSDGIDDDNEAFALFAKIGNDRSVGGWSFGVKYAEIEIASVNPILNDGDFGSADKEGFVLRGAYRNSKWMSWHLSVFDVDQIVTTGGGFQLVQLDCQIKF